MPIGQADVGDLFGGLFHMLCIRFTVFLRRCPHSNQNQLCLRYDFSHTRRETDRVLYLFKKTLDAGFMNRTFSLVQKVEFALVFVHCSDIMIQIGEHHSRGQADISCSYDCNFHFVVFGSPRRSSVWHSNPFIN